jgi:hypothetical protein
LKILWVMISSGSVLGMESAVLLTGAQWNMLSIVFVRSLLMQPFLVLLIFHIFTRAAQKNRKLLRGALWSIGE